MANRLTKIYTRTGDRGQTRLATGEQVAKSGQRIETCGDLDEANSAIGLLLCQTGVPETVHAMLTTIQHELFEIGAELALPGRLTIRSGHVARLEAELDLLNDGLPPLKDFILPGGTPAAAACHVARAVCRRAERSAWRLAEEAELNPELLKYLNRLSDLLFVMARVIARKATVDEPIWEQADREKG